MQAAELVFWAAIGILAYTWVVYPALIVVWGSRRWPKPEPAHDPAELPTVSLLVAAYNEADWIEAKLRNFYELDYPSDRLELLIGSDASDDGTDDRVRALAEGRVRLIRMPCRVGKPSVLNRLAAEARGDILVLSDANTRFDRHAVRHLVAPFADPRVAVVSGRLELREAGSGESRYWRYETAIKRAEGRLGVLVGAVGGIYAVRRSCFEPLPPHTLVDDFVVAMRNLDRGYEVRFAEAAVAYEESCPTLAAEMVRKVRIAARNSQALGWFWRLLLPWKGKRALVFWSHKVLRWLTPFLLLAMFVASVALCTEPGYAGVLLAQVGFYALAGWGQRAHAARGRLAAIAHLAGYMLATQGALVAGLFRLMRGTQKVTWERGRRG